jgi:hypothetical protein
MGWGITNNKWTLKDGKWSLGCCCEEPCPTCNCSTFDDYGIEGVSIATLSITATDADPVVQCAIDAINAELPGLEMIWDNYFFSLLFIGEKENPGTYCSIDWDRFTGQAQCQNLGGIWNYFMTIGFTQDSTFDKMVINISADANSCFEVCGPCEIRGTDLNFQIQIVPGGIDKIIKGDYIMKFYRITHPCNSYLREFFDMFTGQGLIDILQKKDRI